MVDSSLHENSFPVSRWAIGRDRNGWPDRSPGCGGAGGARRRRRIPPPVWLAPRPPIGRQRTRGSSLGSQTASRSAGTPRPVRQDTAPRRRSSRHHARRFRQRSPGASVSPGSGLPGERRPYELTPADSARWPVKGPAPLPGAAAARAPDRCFLREPQVHADGHPGSAAAGRRCCRSSSGRPRSGPRPTRDGRSCRRLHLIATVAQGKPGRGREVSAAPFGPGHRAGARAGPRSGAGWCSWTCRSGTAPWPAELPHLVKYLERPYVHLALDPEFAMKLGGVPGRADRHARRHGRELRRRAPGGHRRQQEAPAEGAGGAPVHPAHADQPRQDRAGPAGAGSGRHGRLRRARGTRKSAYKLFIVPEPVQYAGFKLFYKNDKPMMTPAQVTKLWPAPVYMQYRG